jgi:IS605 OrfB family transposase
MKANRTIKLKLNGKFSKIEENLPKYLSAANWLSEVIFNRQKIQTPNSLAKEFYAHIRAKFDLPSQLTLSMIRFVVSSYRSMKSNKNWSLAVFKKQSLPICFNRDFSYSQKRGLRIWNTPFTFKSRKFPQNNSWSDSKLVRINGNWYLNLVIKIEIPEPKLKGFTLGVDSGIKNIATATSPLNNKTFYAKGNSLNHRRKQIRRVRSKVSSVGTSSAKRLLKRLNRKEASVTQEELHLASKRLVTFAVEQNTKILVLEDLTGIRKESRKKFKQPKKFRSSVNRWPFRMFQFFLEYKAQEAGIQVEYLDPKNSSRSCPRCGHTEKSNRQGLVFRCLSCEYEDNSDRIGALNMSLRSILSRQAEVERAVVNQLIVSAS